MDTLKATGHLVITLTDRETGLTRVIETPNKVVNVGLRFLATKISWVQETRTIKSIHIGTSSQPVDAEDYGLVAEVASATLTSMSSTGATIFCSASFDEGVGTADITELGLFLSDGTLLARTVIPVQTKSATTTMDVTWALTLQPV